MGNGLQPKTISPFSLKIIYSPNSRQGAIACIPQAVCQAEAGEAGPPRKMELKILDRLLLQAARQEEGQGKEPWAEL